MPTTKRARRHARSGFSDEQHEWLLHGNTIFGAAVFVPVDEPNAAVAAPIFDSVAAERAAWRDHRAELMAEFDVPGRRPFGYWRHDLSGVIPDPFNWPGELMALLDRGLVTAEEAVRLECMRQMLAPEQGSFCSSFDNPAMIRHLGLASEHLAREFDAAAAFHRWRNRAEIAAVYAERAASVRAVAGEAVRHAPSTTSYEQ